MSGSDIQQVEPDQHTRLAARLSGRGRGERERILLDVVRAACVAALEHAGRPVPDDLPAQTPVRTLGVDSLAAVDLQRRLTAATGLDLPVTLVFDHPTPGDLARTLTGRLAGDDDPETDTPRGAPGAGDEPIAIIGMACR